MGVLHQRIATVPSSWQGYNEIVPPWGFQEIPPERQGLRGEYDYHGLAKRVHRCYQDNFRATDLAQLTVQQRGRVISLHGRVPSTHHLQKLVQLAITTPGAARVETHGVVVLAPSST
jgi:hypothetical protein